MVGDGTGWRGWGTYLCGVGKSLVDDLGEHVDVSQEVRLEFRDEFFTGLLAERSEGTRN